jgi:hypothetical protein
MLTIVIDLSDDEKSEAVIRLRIVTKRTKQIGLLFLVGALVALLLLASSLSNLQLQAGTAFPGSGNSNNAAQADKSLPPIEIYSLPMQRGIFALIFIILMIYVPVRIITLVNIKMILRLIPAIVILIIIVYMMPRIPPGQPAPYPNGPSKITTPPSFHYSITPLGEPPQVLIWLVILGIGLGMILAAVKIVKEHLGANQIEAELLQEAEAAVNALEAGVDLRNVILRCYLQMTRSLREERGIERDYSMTVREFEDWLESLGFPTAPVHLLTGLFEKVRYGKQQMSDNDEKIAIQSLNEIIQYCRSDKD